MEWGFDDNHEGKKMKKEVIHGMHIEIAVGLLQYRVVPCADTEL